MINTNYDIIVLIKRDHQSLVPNDGHLATSQGTTYHLIELYQSSYGFIQVGRFFIVIAGKGNKGIRSMDNNFIFQSIGNLDSIAKLCW